MSEQEKKILSTVTIRMTKKEKQEWSKFAEEEGRSLSGWIRWAVNSYMKTKKS